jgi:putative endonuclease
MHEGSYFTYIMASRSHTLYIGVTSDLHKRVFQHKWKEQDGFTARYNCDRLVKREYHPPIRKVRKAASDLSPAGADSG